MVKITLLIKAVILLTFFLNSSFMSSKTLINKGSNIIIKGPVENGVYFKDSQRKFTCENTETSTILKSEVNGAGEKNSSAEVEKIRISFKSPFGYYRQILVGAIPSATNGFDLGYDAHLYDNNKEDMYWIQGENWLVIQGVADFGKDQVLPLGINIKEKGEFTIKIDELQNIADTKNIYIKDKELNVIHDLRKSPYKATAEGGYSNERFELVFFKETAANEEPPIVTKPKLEIPDDGARVDGDVATFSVRYSNNTKEFQILNPDQVTLSNMYIFDISGNQVMHYGNISQDKEVRLPVRNYSSGVYTIKLYSGGRAVTKKILIGN